MAIQKGPANLGAASVDSTELSNTLDLSAKTVTYRTIVAGDIASNAITTAKITDANITPAKMANSGAELGMRNRIINGDMRIDQRNAGGSLTNIYGGVFPVDRFSAYGSVTSKYTIQQTPSATETGFATRVNAGFTNYLMVTSSGVTTFSATDEYEIFHKIEGTNVADLAWGTSNAKTVTLSFWVRSSLTGTFGGQLSNASYNRSYVFSYTINAANTWEQKTITIAGEQSGSWSTGTGIGIYLAFDLGSGTSNRTTAGSWTAGYYTSVTGAVSVLGTSGATYAITGVQLEAGSTATPFERRLYGTELQLCQRYYQKYTFSGGTAITIGECDSTASAVGGFRLNQEMRAAPSVTIPSAGSGGGGMSFLTSTGNWPGTFGTLVTAAISNVNFRITQSGATGAFSLGNATWLYPASTAYITADAEL